MPESPLKEGIDNVSIEVLIGGAKIKDEYGVLSVDVDRQINKISTAKIVILLEWGDEEGKSFEPSESDDFKPGKEIEIKAGYVDTNDTIFKGIITNHAIKCRSGQRSQLIISGSDSAVKLTLGRKSKYYKEMVDSAIISGIIGDTGLEKDVESTTFSHKQLIQYHAIDWDFIITRAEANGLIVYTTDGKVFAKKPLSSGEAELKVSYDSDVFDFDAQIESRYQIPSVSSHSWDMKAQDLFEGTSSEPTINAQGDITGKTLSEIMALSDFEIHSTGPIDKNELKDWANAQLLRSRLSSIRGSVTFFGNALPKLNTLIELDGFGARFNGSALISGVKHDIRQGVWRTTTDFGLSHELFYEKQTVSTPPAGGLLPAIHGLQNGTVKKIDADPDGEHRIQVDVPMIDKAGDGIWARLATFYSTSTKGSFFMPEVGDEVVLGFLNNDPRYPIILGSIYSSKITPPYTADAENSIKAIVTKEDLKVEFDDKNKVITIQTPGGNKMTISDKDKSITIEDQNSNKIEMGSSGITLESASDVMIKAKAGITLKASSTIAVDAGSGQVSVKGSTVEANASGSVTVKGSGMAELSSGGNTTVKGAVVMIN